MRIRILTILSLSIVPCLFMGTPSLLRESSANLQASPSLVESASKFIGLLTPEQKAKAVLAYGSQDRVKWHFIPLETRKGLPVMEMNEAQKEAAYNVLKSALSEAGNKRSRTIMNYENLLLKLEGPASAGRRNPLKYYFTLFGEPTAKGLWGLSIEGHHLSLNFVVEDGKIVDSTPQVFASNPAELKADYGDGFPKGQRIIQEEETLAFSLVTSLSDAQKKTAIIADKALAEVRWVTEPQPHVEPARGIPTSELNDAQKGNLKQLIQAYTSKMTQQVSDDRWALIEKGGLDKISFAWAGPTEPGIGHYYCIQGPSFIVEFVNTQADAAGNPANHIHCIWRDLTGDFNLPISQ